MSEKDQDAKALVNDIFEKRDRDRQRIELERVWWRNFLYWKGDQWIQWFVDISQYKKQFPTTVVPTPVANFIRSSVRDESAIILNKDYVPRIYPNSDTTDDIATAKMGNMLIKDMDLSNDEEFMEEKERVVKWFLLFGTAFMRTFPDKNRGDYGFDSKGNIIQSGEVVTEALLPFSIVLDPMGDTLKKKRYVGIHSYRDREWIKDNFGEEIKTDSNKERVRYLYSLARYVSEASPIAVGTMAPFDDNEDLKDLVEFKELEFKPTNKFPNGRYIVMANDDVLIDSNSLPIKTDRKKNQWSYSITDFHYDKIPGAFWSDSFVQDLISPQNSINRIDQDEDMNRHSIGKAKLIMALGTRFEKINLNGDIYDAIVWDPMVTAGIPPKFDSGKPLPEQILKMRDIHRATIQDSSGNPSNVLRGEIPTAGASALLVDVLQESAESSHTPTIRAYFRSLTKVYRKRILLAKKLYTEERTLKVVGPNRELEIKKFKASTLGDNTDIRLEPATSAFGTKASEVHTMLKLVQTGMLENDPVTKNDLFRKLGLGDLIGDMPNIHAARAEREHLKIAEGEFEGIFLTQGNEAGRPDMSPDASIIYDDPLFELDNHAIHYDSHLRKAMTDEFLSWELKNQRILIAHTLLHKDAMDRAIEEAQIKAIKMQAIQQQAMEPPQEEEQEQEVEPGEFNPEGAPEEQFIGA